MAVYFRPFLSYGHPTDRYVKRDMTVSINIAPNTTVTVISMYSMYLFIVYPLLITFR